LYEGSEELSDVVKAPKIKKNHASSLRKFMWRICFLFSGKQKENHEDRVEVTIEKSETNPYFVPDSALSSFPRHASDWSSYPRALVDLRSHAWRYHYVRGT
jgi:hypothetical protein